MNTVYKPNQHTEAYWQQDWQHVFLCIYSTICNTFEGVLGILKWRTTKESNNQFKISWIVYFQCPELTVLLHVTDIHCS